MDNKSSGELITALVNQTSGMMQLLLQQQALLTALLKYAQEQPGHDAPRFGSIWQAERERLTLPAVQVKDLTPALQALLRDFEGPIH